MCLLQVLNVKVEEQQREITNLKLEIEALSSENDHLSGEKSSQFSQLQDLQSFKSQNENLTQDLKSMAQKNMELTHKISHLEARLKEASNSKEQVELIDNLKTKLGKLHKERSVAVEKEEFYQKQIGDLRYEVETLKQKVQSVEVTKDRVLEEYYKVLSELQYLKKNYNNEKSDKNFKDFVKLKREVVELREENLEYRKGIKGIVSCSSASSLPMLKFEVDTPLVKSGSKKKGQRTKKAASLV
jgi:chromosome segregation ATPase